MTDKKAAAFSRTEYWRQARRLTAILVLLWLLATFAAIFFARELSSLTLFGWPFSFYMAGQGLPLFYLVLVAIYFVRMQRLDKKLRDGQADVK